MENSNFKLTYGYVVYVCCVGFARSIDVVCDEFYDCATGLLVCRSLVVKECIVFGSVFAPRPIFRGGRSFAHMLLLFEQLCDVTTMSVVKSVKVPVVEVDKRTN